MVEGRQGTREDEFGGVVGRQAHLDDAVEAGGADRGGIHRLGVVGGGHAQDVIVAACAVECAEERTQTVVGVATAPTRVKVDVVEHHH